MFKNKKILVPFLGLIFTLILFTSTIFAWITLANRAEVDNIIITLGKVDAKIELRVNKNASEFVGIETTQEMQSFFSNTVPSDIFGFKLLIKNESDGPVLLSVSLSQIYGTIVDDVNLLDVFYLQDGRYKINGVVQEPVAVNSEEITTFNQYRFSNIIKNSNLYFNKFNIEFEGMLEIEFYIGYDENTSDSRYQVGEFKFDGIIVNFE